MSRDVEQPAEAAFERSIAPYLGGPGVTAGTGFGANAGLRVGGRIFAMLHGSALVVKLPAARVDEAVAGRLGRRFEAGRGRPMREWLEVPTAHAGEWPQLVEEAFRFVRG